MNNFTQKDWVGGNASVFKSIGATNHSDSERADKDFYATDPIAIDALKKKVDLPHFILEPACGIGSLSERLKELGHRVWSYDLINRGYGEVQNFFEMLTLPGSLSLSLCGIEVCNSHKPSIQVRDGVCFAFS